MLAGLLLPALATVRAAEPKPPVLAWEQLAHKQFGPDATWFLANIPFLEIDDPELEQIYYYRWKLFRAHIREIGAEGTTVIEFLPDVPWAREPYTDLNDSASFHLAEGRWLRDETTVNALIDHLYTGGANDRHFSESLAAAAEATTRVTGDPAPALRHLDTMEHIFNLWDDHLDRQRNLYWIEPLLDATEYTISSIDASGAGFTDHPSTDQNRNGFTGGYAFRPSINSYQYANALAIARLADLDGKPSVAADFRMRSARLQRAVLDQLWNPALQHFTDRYQRSTAFAKEGEFVRGRELVGYTPWLYELPPKEASQDAAAWKHLLSTAELAGPAGLRTVEPTYPKYMQQYRYDQATGLRECQWNGPSWPFQTSQTLTALANFLDDYPQQDTVSRADYLRLLRQYTHQHYLTPGYPDLQEDYDPDRGGPIVGLPRSHHYAHSTYVDLVLSGLLGIRPRADETLEIAPLIPLAPTGDARPIRYFALDHLAYHGHHVAVFYDADGSRYHIGSGLSVFVDDVRAYGPGPLTRVMLPLPKRPVDEGPRPHRRIDLLVNPGLPFGAKASASSSANPEGIAEAIDGRMWFFPEIANGWSPVEASIGPGHRESWYAVQLPEAHEIASVELAFLGAEAQHLAPPASFRLEQKTSTGWQEIPGQRRSSSEPIANGVNRVEFAPMTTNAVRVVFTPPAAVGANFRLVELKAFGPEPEAAR